MWCDPKKTHNHSDWLIIEQILYWHMYHLITILHKKVLSLKTLELNYKRNAKEKRRHIDYIFLYNEVVISWCTKSNRSLHCPLMKLNIQRIHLLRVNQFGLIPCWRLASESSKLLKSQLTIKPTPPILYTFHVMP